jgi:hypothetical protein
MIYVAKSNAKEEVFLNLLSKSRILVLDFLKSPSSVSPLYFETVVFEQMCKASKGTEFEGTVKQTGAQAFPDIVANRFFGVEVKMTTQDHWISTGNSILESLRIADVERIYIVFGKFGGKFDLRYRLYQECLPEISVTHSPRYRINMDLPSGKSIFDKIGIDYDILRKEKNVIKKIKDYYRAQLKDGEELWWIDQENDDKAVSPIIRPFRSLSTKDKENFIIEAMILFPEMFGNSMTKFERAAAFLIAEYNSVSANLRDLFTAGGRVKIKLNGKMITVPKLIYHLHERAKMIKKSIYGFDEKTLSYYWRCEKINKDRLKQWKGLLDEKFNHVKLGVKVSSIFESGLL